MIKSLTITAIVIFLLMGINPSVGSEKIQIVPSEYEGKEAGDDCEGKNLDDFVYQGTLAWEDAGYCVKDEECEPAEHLICIGTGVGGFLPDFRAENAAKVSASFGGLVYMTLAMLVLFVAIGLQAYPTFRVYDALSFSGKLSDKVLLVAAVGYALSLVVSFVACKVSLAKGAQALDARDF